jgi:hypothetical protein
VHRPGGFLDRLDEHVQQFNPGSGTTIFAHSHCDVIVYFPSRLVCVWNSTLSRPETASIVGTMVLPEPVGEFMAEDGITLAEAQA